MFQPLSSSAQASFWQELAKLKVDVLGLDQKPLPITGTYAALVAAPPARIHTPTTTLPARLTVGIESLSLSSSPAAAAAAAGGAGTGPSPPQLSLAKECRVPGIVQNFNTDEAFRAFNKKAWLDGLGEEIWADIMEAGMEAAVLQDPGRLARFAILCFADIKRNAFIYWFAFPAVVSDPPFRHLRPPTLLAGAGGSGGGGGGGTPFFSDAECLLLHSGLQAFRQGRLLETGDASCPPFFLVFRSLTTSTSPEQNRGGGSSSLSLEICPLEAFEKLDEKQHAQQSVMFGFIDPGTVPLAPGWPLRNFLLLLANRWKLKKATVLCYRGRVTSLAPADSTAAPSSSSSSSSSRLSPAEAARAMGGSFVLHTALKPLSSCSSSSGSSLPSSSSPSLSTKGWELHKGKYMPRRIDLSSMMDPIRLAEQSVDLNLKLMRWRLLPALNIPLLAQTKCLLIGAGTLGCSVARGLLGWGVRNITLIDNGKVALSNPVRQSLFEYADCLDGGKPKAAAAAAALKRIFPGVVAEGHVMTIPMPGHPLASAAEQTSARADIEKLDGLVRECDVVFLLTDTRESRWLPTVLAAVHDKILLNAALGFDTFMVMRHGAQPLPSPPPPSSNGGEGKTSNNSSSSSSNKKMDLNRIGCYFCNDVVAPEDSTKDRTLDQQCTVTRPGLAPLASALAVELMVALLHHPLRHRAPADGGQGEGGGEGGLGRRFEDDPDRPLGILPQQIRGFLAQFTTILPVTRAFEHCTGCAAPVVEAYRKEGAGLVVRVCNGQGVLEEMTGLAQMRREADAMDMLWLDEEEEEEGEEEEGDEEGVELDLGVGGLTLDGGGTEEGKGKKEDEAKENGGDAGDGNGGGNDTGEAEDAAVMAWRKRIS